ncbi:MAG: class I SAM-dependent methyltransferase [Leptolyngbyaceae bacterium]|nr:class I SAM-dependent methyltransferase [Leptolyngbyaceae bacterium]
MTQTNLFSDEHITHTYNDVRPNIYPSATQVILDYCFSINAACDKILDIGCGTGRSTQPFRRVANRVLGVDPSPQIIRQAIKSEGVEFRIGSAESLPTDEKFDLAIASMAFHYFDRSKFLSELNRVLSPSGIFVACECGFGGDIGNPGYKTWLSEDLFAQYPDKVERKRISSYFKDGSSKDENSKDESSNQFRIIHQQTYTYIEGYTPERLVTYVLSKSNFANLSHSEIRALRKRIYQKLIPYWSSTLKLVKFRGKAWFITRKTNEIINRKRNWYMPLISAFKGLRQV